MCSKTKLINFLLLFLIPLQADEQVIKIGIVPWIAWTPLYVAEELGFWRKEGLNIEIINYANIREKISSFKNGLTDISFGEPADFLPLIEEGIKIRVILCVDMSYGADKFYIRKDFKPDELKGRKIAISPFPAGDFFINRGLKIFNVDPEDLIFINVDSPSMALEAFIGGKVDGAYVYPPSSFRIEKSGIAFELFNSKKFPIYEALFSRDEIYERNSEKLKKILKGWLMAVEWSSKKDNFDKFLEIARRNMYFRMKEFDYESWKRTMEEIRIFSKTSDIYRINTAEGEFWKYLSEEINFLSKKKIITKKILPQDLIDQKIWKSVLKEIHK